MSRPRFGAVLGINSIALALLAAGCGGTSLPQNASRPQQAGNSAGARAGAPKHSTTSTSTTIYVSDGGTNDVTLLSYPSYNKIYKIKKLADPAGVCADASGNVWIVESKSNTLVEYAHDGKKHIGSLNDSAAGLPFACSVDPTTGNLAVTSMYSTSGAGVLIYTAAQGTPTVYTSTNLAVAYYCAYDASGNLFIDGLNSSYAFVLMELPAGATQLQSVSLSGTITFPGGVAWDGQYLAIGDESYQGGHSSVIDDVSVSGTSATIVATIPLNKSCEITQFAFLGGTAVAAPDACRNVLHVYPYPTGGNPIKTLPHFQYPIAAAVSVGP